jgi:hypothetical protein
MYIFRVHVQLDFILFTCVLSVRYRYAPGTKLDIVTVVGCFICNIIILRTYRMFVRRLLTRSLNPEVLTVRSYRSIIRIIV